MKSYFLWVLLLIAAFFLFYNLGDRLLWGDEAFFGLLGKTTLKYGYPSNFDGTNIIYGNFEGTVFKFYNASGVYVWKWHPWLIFYILAASIKIFGSNTLSIRLFPAFFGLLTVLMMYLFALKLTKNKTIANLATVLLVFCVPFYMYSRQGTYYSLSLFLSLVVLFAYLKVLNREKHGVLLFTVSSILLFYTTYFPFFSIYAGIVLHYIIFHRKINLHIQLLISSIIIAIFTLPWYIYSSLGTKIEVSILGILFGILYLFIYYSVYIFPAILWIFVPFLIFKKYNKKIIIDDGYFLILFVIFIGLCVVNLAPWELPQFRYIIFLIPLALILTAGIFALILRYNKYVFAIILLIFIFSNLLYIFPFKLFEPIFLNSVENDSESYYFIQENLRYRFFLMDYVDEITHSYVTPNQVIVDYLIKNGKRRDVFLTNDADTVILFYTNLTIYRTNLNRTPDWIIPRKPNYIWSKYNDSNYQFVVDRIDYSYKKIILNSTDYLYLLDEPLPRTHRFIYDKENKILNRFETYPIEIYHLSAD